MISDLFDEQLLRITLILAAPLLIAAFGELINHLSGVLNLSIEGQMTLAASVTFSVIFWLGDGGGSVIAAVAAAMGATMLIGLALAYLSVTRRANQIAVGLGLLIASFGAAALLYRLVVGVPASQPGIKTLSALHIPGLADLPFLGRIFFSHNIAVYVVIAVIIVVSWVLFRTSLGLSIRATGENPRSADSAGLPVYKIRYFSLLTGSALIGVGGALFPLTLAGGFSEGMLGGRGWLALLLVIFGRWRPLPIFLGALFFAYLDGLSFQFAVTRHDVPIEFLQMLPYVAAAVVIATLYGRTRAPGALAKSYDREARHE
jgi:ABC-type uncharacterized transport system permease subunit